MSGTVIDRIATGDRTPATGEVYPLDAVTLLEPIPGPPAIFCIGRNYADHIAEMGSAKPEKPIVFLKLPLSSAPPSGPVRRPKATEALDYETELVLVMGPDNEVAGYAVANDVSARDLQKSEPQWARAKALRHVLPLGSLDHDQGRDPRPPRPATHDPCERRVPPRRQHIATDLRPRGPDPLHFRGLHPGAGGDHPHRHAQRRRRGCRSGFAARSRIPRSGDGVRSRSRGWA